MQRIDSDEILDSNMCPPAEVEKSLRDLCRINRWFGGVSTTQSLIERVATVTRQKHFSLLEVASGFGEVPRAAAAKMARAGVTVDVTDLDRMPTHLQRGHRALIADARALPFADASFDLVSCSLFAHHLQPADLAGFSQEACRVSRAAVLINDLIRHPMHLALVYAGFPLMRSYVSRNDGVASVRRAYTCEEMQQMLSGDGLSNRKVEITSHYLFRMGVIIWKNSGEA